MPAKQAARRGSGGASKRRQSGARTIDFTGVEAGGGRLLPEDTYSFECVDIDPDQIGEDSGEPYWAATFEVVEGDFKGTKAWDNFSLQPQALWKLRSFLESAGFPTEDGPMDIDPNDLIGLVGSADIIHETFKNKPKHRINSWMIDNQEPPAKAEREERPARGGNGAKRVSRREPEPEDENEWKVRDQVQFKDGKKTLDGRIKSIDGDDVTVTVKGDGDYEMKLEDLIPID
jgi:hypothetical protein